MREGERAAGRLLQREGRSDRGRDDFVERGGVVVALPTGGGGVKWVNLHDAHAGGAEFLEATAALRGDLLGASAGVAGGFGHHFHFGFAGYGVDEVDPAGDEGRPFIKELGAIAAKLLDAVDVGGFHADCLGELVADALGGVFAVVVFFRAVSSRICTGVRTWSLIAREGRKRSTWASSALSRSLAVRSDPC